MFEEHQVIGPYELVRRLGAGAFGEVWLARHLDLDDLRAMKIPTDPDCVRQLRKEGRIQFGLRHPNIVQTLDLNTRHEPPYFVMEYVDGEDLRKTLNRDGPLPLKPGVRIVRKILRALQAAHAQGVLHRDLKPENVLVTAQGAVKVADFGLGKVQAQVAQSLFLSGSMVSVSGRSVSGTFEYMSPEQRAGQEPTPRDDLYSLGILACELLTGRRPSAAGVARTLRRAEVAPSIAAIIEKACDDFDYRYATADEMLADLSSKIRPTRAARPPSEAAGGGSPAPVSPAPPEAARPAARPRPQAATGRRKETQGSAGMQFCLIEPGTFPMGSEGGRDDERPVHEVGIRKAFYLAVHPVTRGEYERVTGHGPPLAGAGSGALPVEFVSWQDAVAFCRAVSEREGAVHRLPTEAEWEYACRAGSRTDYCFGDAARGLGAFGWFRDNSGGTLHPVRRKKPNAWGLYDLHGNVWEWCGDWHGAYSAGAASDPRGPARGKKRVLRGGAAGFGAALCRSAARHALAPARTAPFVGFRLVRELA